MGKDKNVLYLGNLRRDLHVTDLKNNLLDLFCDFIGIEIDWNDIDIRKGKHAWFAFVDLHNEREASETLEELASWENRRNLRYNFLHIVPPLESLAVDYKKVKKVKKNKKVTPKDGNESEASGSKSKTVSSDKKKSSATKSHDQKNQIKSNNKPTTNKPAALANQGPEGKAKSLDLVQNDKTANQTPNIDVADPVCVISTVEHKDKEATIITKSETGLSTLPNGTTTELPLTTEQEQGKCFTQGQSLGNETRNKEFKLGGGNYQKRVLREHVCKYTCGFLNSAEGGQLLIGVQDDGIVAGIDIDRDREDECRLTIDDAIKTLNPAIFPNMYGINFIPVVAKGVADKENLKVIEILIFATESDVLYATSGDVYIRRDGSLQGPLKGAEIQEWTKKECSDEVK